MMGFRTFRPIETPFLLVIVVAGVVIGLAACGGGGSTAAVRGTEYPGLDQDTANAAYDDGYRACYGPTEVTASAVANVTSEYGGDYRPVVSAGCEDANLDISACVAPIYYNNGGPYYCGDHSSADRPLRNPDGSASAARCSWDDEFGFGEWRCDENG